MLLSALRVPLCLCAFVVSLSAAEPARLQLTRDDASHTLALRAGPVALPAGGGIGRLGYAAPLEVSMPLSGWAVAFQLRLVDESGVEIPGRLLRRVALENPARADLLCPKQPERLFAAYSAPLALPEFPGIGFSFELGDKIRLFAELHNPAEQAYRQTYVEIRIYFRERGKTSLPVVSVFPLWIETRDCTATAADTSRGGSGLAAADTSRGGSGLAAAEVGYDLPPGREVRRREFQIGQNGKLLAATATGGQFTDRVLIERLPGGTLADLSRQPGSGFPLANWMPRGGISVSSGERFRLTAEFNNPAPTTQRGAGTAALLAYFLPLQEK